MREEQSQYGVVSEKRAVRSGKRWRKQSLGLFSDRPLRKLGKIGISKPKRSVAATEIHWIHQYRDKIHRLTEGGGLEYRVHSVHRYVDTGALWYFVVWYGHHETQSRVHRQNGRTECG